MRLVRELRAALSCRRGVSAVEFALILPILLFFAIGTYEVTALVRVNMKLTRAAGALAKIIAQQSSSVTSGTTGTLGDICTGAALEMTPFATKPFSAAIVSVTNSSGSSVAMDWESDGSCTTAATAMGSAAAVTRAGAYGLVPNAGDSVVMVKATYAYTSVLHYALGKSFALTQYGYARPRTGATVACSNC